MKVIEWSFAVFLLLGGHWNTPSMAADAVSPRLLGAWLVESAENGRNGDYHPTPWVFKRDGTVSAEPHWSGTWQVLDDDSFQMQIIIDDQVVDAFTLHLKPQERAFVARKHGKDYRYAIGDDKGTQTAGIAVITPPDETTRKVIFDGSSLAHWQGFAFNGGVSFADTAKLKDAALLVEIPSNKGWAKAGIWHDKSVFELPELHAQRALHIAAGVDMDESTGFSLALLPREQAGKDPWQNNVLRLQVRPARDGIADVVLSAGSVELKAVGEKTFQWPKGRVSFEWIVDAQGVARVLADGSQVALFPIRKQLAEHAGKELLLHAFAQVPRKHVAASVHLASLKTWQSDSSVDVDYSIVDGADRNITLFDGNSMAPLWGRKDGVKGLYYDHVVALSQGALRVAWPKDNPSVMAGLSSKQPVIWLDRFHGDAESRITIEIDGENSQNFTFRLGQTYINPGNAPGRGDYVLSATRQADDTFTLTAGLQGKKDTMVSHEGVTDLPDQYTLVLTPELAWVEWLMRNGERKFMPGTVFPQAIDGAGLRLEAYARRTPQMGGALVLRRVDLQQRQGPEPVKPSIAPGVDPLPRSVLFSGTVTDAWKGVTAADAMFEQLSADGPDGLRLKRRTLPPNGNRIALQMKKPLVVLDERIKQTGFEVRLRLDPNTENLGARIYLASSPGKYKDGPFAVSLRRDSKENPAAPLELTLHSDHFHYGYRTKRFPPGWESLWDGELTLVLNSGRMDVRLGGDIGVSVQTDSIKPNRPYYLVLEPGGVSYRDDGEFLLKHIEAGWVTPDAMTAVERGLLVDGETFDAAQFVTDLANTMAGESE